MIYKNAKPEFQEFGPYIYQEYDAFNNLTYSRLQNSISQSDLESVFTNYSRSLQPSATANDASFDQPLFMPNQGLFGIWFQQSAGDLPENRWKVYLNVLNEQIYGNLGNYTTQKYTFENIRENYIWNWRTLDDKLANGKLNFYEGSAMFEDPYYGLK